MGRAAQSAPDVEIPRRRAGAGNRRGLPGRPTRGGRSEAVRDGGPRCGAFPNAARPRTVWLGAGAGAEQMVTLHDRVEDPLAELGYREEHRQFQPHLTIGRVRGGGPGIAELGKLIQQHAQFAAGRMTVQSSRVCQHADFRRPDLRSPRHGAVRLVGVAGVTEIVYSLPPPKPRQPADFTQAVPSLRRSREEGRCVLRPAV